MSDAKNEREGGRGDGGRAVRLGQALKMELAQVIAREVKDPRVQNVGLLTVTDVQVAPDLKVARVWVSFVATEPKQIVAALEGLGRAAGFLRGELGRRLGLKHTPELRFEHDRTGEHAEHLARLLKDEP